MPKSKFEEYLTDEFGFNCINTSKSAITPHYILQYGYVTKENYHNKTCNYCAEKLGEKTIIVFRPGNNLINVLRGTSVTPFTSRKLYFLHVNCFTELMVDMEAEINKPYHETVYEDD